MCGSNDNLPVFAGRRMQTQGPGTGRTAENAPQERQRGTERDYNRSTQFVDSLLNIFNPKKAGEQTTTQQNLPSWAIPDAMSTLGMGNYYTQTPDYRPSTLDRDYSGIRGGASGVGQFGLNPRKPALPGTNLDGTDQYRPNDLENLVSELPPDMRGSGLNLGPFNFGRSSFKPGTGLKFADQMPATSGRSTFKSYEGAPKGGVSNSGGLNTINSQSESTGENDGSTNSFNYWNDLVETITNPYNQPVDPSQYSESNSPEYYDDTIPKNGSADTTTTAEETSTVDPKDIFNPDDLTPFQAYDRQRFAAPGQNTLRGEGILAGRYNQRFGPGGTDPFAAATTAVNKAAGYGSTYKGLMDSESTLAQSGGYQTGLGTATDPNIFKSGDYTADLKEYANPNKDLTNLNKELLASKYASANKDLTADEYSNKINDTLLSSTKYENVVNPIGTDYGNTNSGMTSTDFGNVNQGVTGRSYANENVNQTNVNANLTNPLQGLEPVTFESANQGLTSSTYGNANQGLRGPQDYNRGFQSLLNQSFNPYQDQVVNQTIQDLDRARRISENDIRGQAAKAGAFGSREELLRAENNRNYLDRVAAATGQLRSQGFESAANRASQENLQRLGLTASDIQNVRGLQSQGNLQGQSLSAAADQQLRGLQSQGNLQAQNLTASDRASARDLAGRGALQTQALQSQGGLQAQNLQAQGAQAAQGLTAQSDRQTQALQSQGALAGQSLTAQDAQQVRSLISQGGLQGQNLTAADRQQLNDLVSRGALQSQNLSAADRQQLNDLVSRGALQGQSLTASANQQLQGLLSQGNLQGQQLGAADLQNVRNLISQGGLAAQGLQSQGALAALGANAGLYQSALGLNAAGDRSAMGYNAGLLSDAMGLDAADLQQRRNLASNEAQFRETANRGAGALNLQGGQALGQLAQAGTADERQRIADILAAGGAGDARNQQDLDFIFNEFNRELAYPSQQIDLRNRAISPATNSVVTQTQDVYGRSPLSNIAALAALYYGAV